MMDTKTYAQALVDYAGISASEVSDYLDGSNPGIDWTDLDVPYRCDSKLQACLSKALKELKRMFPLTIWVMKVSLTKIVMNVIRLKPTLRSLWLNGWMLLSIKRISWCW